MRVVVEEGGWMRSGKGQDDAALRQVVTQACGQRFGLPVTDSACVFAGSHSISKGVLNH